MDVSPRGAPEDLYARPADMFIAGFLGAANFVPGDVSTGDDGRTVVRHGDLCLTGAVDAPISGRAVAMLRPEDGSLHAQPPADGSGNLLPGAVVHSEFLGGRWRHVIAVAHDLTVQVLTSARAPATKVWLSFPIDRCLLLPETS